MMMKPIGDFDYLAYLFLSQIIKEYVNGTSNIKNIMLLKSLLQRKLLDSRGRSKVMGYI
jgi:hypothetical protein